MRDEPIRDPEGDRILAQERRDRELEKASDPSIYLGPLERCEVCRCYPQEFAEGHWGCACSLPVGAAL